MSKYLLYKLFKNCAEIPNGYQNIAVSLGGLFLTHPVCMCIFGIYCFIEMYVYKCLCKNASKTGQSL